MSTAVTNFASRRIPQDRVSPRGLFMHELLRTPLWRRSSAQPHPDRARTASRANLVKTLRHIGGLGGGESGS